MPISPQTQALMQVPTDADAQQAFEQGFGDAAMRVFTTKYPEMTPLLSSFKILSSDHEKGSAVGAFILTLQDSEVMVPAILAGNQLKPIDILYHKDTDTFVPFKKEWLDEITRSDIGTMGEPVKVPNTLPRDVDIRNLVVPPMVGRYAYASADPVNGEQTKTTTSKFAARRLKQASVPRIKLGSGEALIAVLQRAPNFVKRAFAKTMAKNKRIAKYAFEHFDQVRFLDALQPVAHSEIAKTADLQFVEVNDPPEHFKEVFGSHAGEAYRHALKTGFAALDKRAEVNQVILEESSIRLSEAKKTGFFLLTRPDGSNIQALVIADPLCPARSGKYDKFMSVTKRPSHYDQHRAKLDIDRSDKDYKGYSRSTTEEKYLVVTEEGKLRELSSAPVGVELQREELRGSLKKILDGEGDAITPNSAYVFVKPDANDMSGTDVVDVSSSTVGSDGVRRIRGYIGTSNVTLVTDPKSPIRKPVLPGVSVIPRQDLVYIPRTMVPIRVERDYARGDEDIATTATAVMLLRNKLMKTGARRVKLSRAGAGEFKLGSAVLSKTAAIKTLMTEYRISDVDALHAVKSAEANRTFSFILATPAQVMKFAQEVAVDPAMQPEAAPPMDPNAGMPSDPNAMAGGGMGPEMPVDPNMGAPMDPNAMGAAMPPAPAPASPVDLAVTELSAGYAQQAADVSKQLADEQQALADRLTLLQQVKMRAEEISASQQAGAMPPPLELPPPETLVPPSDEALAGDPMAAGAPPMDPAQEEAMASEMSQGMETPLSGGVEAAERLNDPAYFESTSLATLANSPSLRDTVSEYLPTLEDTLDHLARMLLELWMKEDQYGTELGDEDYTMLEDQLRTSFNSLGSLLLRVNQLAPSEEQVAVP